MNVFATLYMDRRDVTPWVDSLTLIQAPHTLYLKLDVTFRGWFPPTPTTSRWDLYGSYNTAVPRSELLFRGGIIPPDQPSTVTLDGDVPAIDVQIFDWAYYAQRLSPRRTIVLAPDRSAAQRALAAYEGPVGATAIVIVPTMHAAVRALAAFAALNVELRIPDYPMAARVLAPTEGPREPSMSIWQHIDDLVASFGPRIFFRRDRDTVMITDRMSTELGVGQVLTFAGPAVKSFTIQPSYLRHVRRVLIEVPAA